MVAAEHCEKSNDGGTDVLSNEVNLQGITGEALQLEGGQPPHNGQPSPRVNHWRREEAMMRPIVQHLRQGLDQSLAVGQGGIPGSHGRAKAVEYGWQLLTDLYHLQDLGVSEDARKVSELAPSSGAQWEQVHLMLEAGP